ncbi:MAG: DCC1-like thiol-disulfide oxidoreductase family protein [Vicingaceae bacterium]|nr:DCC1-like thiol-disulfide oxidoreductase family protein [Vicingaceae bacterium]
MQEKSPIILYDDQCSFCSFWVNFVLKKDTKHIFLFAGLSGETAKTILTQYPFAKNTDTVMLLKDNKLYLRSNAALEIANTLGGLLQLFYVFKIVPTFLRDYFYDVIARNRNRLLKGNGCNIQLYQANRNKFLT